MRFDTFQHGNVFHKVTALGLIDSWLLQIHADVAVHVAASKINCSALPSRRDNHVLAQPLVIHRVFRR